MKFTSHISLCMMLALLISSSLLADQKATPVRLPIATGDLPGKELDWYGVYVKDRKNGWARIEMKKVEDGYRLDMQVHIQLKSMGQTSVMDVREVQLFDAEPPYALRALNAVQKDDRFSTTYGVKRVKAETYEATITSGKVVRKKTLSIDYTLADVLCPAIWIRSKPKKGQSLTVRSLDTQELEVEEETYHVQGVKRVRARGVAMTYYETKVVESDGSYLARIDQLGRMISMKMGGLFEFRLESEKLAKQLDKSVDIFVEVMLTLDKPLGGKSPRVQSLVMEVSGKGADKIKNGPHQRVVVENGRRLLKLGVAHGTPLKATKKSIADALKDTVSYPVQHETIQTLLAKVIRGVKTPKQKVDLLIAFVDKYIEDVYGADPQTVFDIIRMKKGDCTEHAALFVTLARAAGVPAREVGGLMYMGDKTKSFGAHAWCEVVLDGHWVPVDPTWGETRADAAHITLERDGGANSLEILGQLKVKLVSVKLSPEKTKESKN